MPDAAHTPDPSDATLSGHLEACLPPGWHLDRITADAQGWLIAVSDDAHAPHVLEIGHRPAAEALTRGASFGYSYRGRDVAADKIALYLGIFEQFRAREAVLSPLLPHPATANAAARPDRRTVTWGERALLKRTAGRPSQVAALLTGIPDDEGVEFRLYLETDCRQTCQFCQLPALRRRLGHRVFGMLVERRRAAGHGLVGTGVFAALLDALARRSPPSALMVLGHDWGQATELEAMLTALEAQPRVGVSFMGPSTRLADPALAARICALPGLETVTLTLQSADPAVHDAIVGAPGAAVQVLAAIDNLLAHGITPGVNVVLTIDTLPGLGDLLRWTAARQLPTGLLGFVPDPGPGRIEGQVPTSDAVRRTLQCDLEAATQAVVSLRGLPERAIPQQLRDRAVLLPE
jgi:hypothetical protein